MAKLGPTTVYGDLKTTGDIYATGTKIEGDEKEMFRFSDVWLRINPNNEFTSGIYCNTSVLRTDGNIQVGNGGSYFNVTSSGAVAIASTLTVKGNTTLGDAVTDTVTLNGKTTSFSTSSNWDDVGFGQYTALKMQGHAQFWIGAGNGTWFKGAGNTKDKNGGIALDASQAHDLLITTMVDTATNQRGITFAAASSATGTAGYRLGKWHSGSAATNSHLVVDGQLFAKGGRNDGSEADYYNDDFSTYRTTGSAAWAGTGMNKPAIVASQALMIQSGNTTTSTVNPQLQFHKHGSGGPTIEYTGSKLNIDVDSYSTMDVSGLQYRGNTVYHAGNFTSGTGAGNWAAGNHTHSYLPLGGGTTTGRITVNGGMTVEGCAFFNGTDAWIRALGATGLYFSTYGGGIYMPDATYTTIYGSKAFKVANDIVATGNITAYFSDERLKTKTRNLENALDKVCSLNGFYYEHNDLAIANGYKADGEHLGLSAQEVQAVAPEIISPAPFDVLPDEHEEGKYTSKTGEDYLTVDYAKLVPLLVEAIKELKEEVEQLKKPWWKKIWEALR